MGGPRTPEGEVKAAIKKFLDANGTYYVMPVQTGFGRRTVDFLICWNGQFVAVETKRVGGRARRYQEMILQDVRNAGGYAICVDSLAALEDWLQTTATTDPRMQLTLKDMALVPRHSA